MCKFAKRRRGGRAALHKAKRWKTHLHKTERRRATLHKSGDEDFFRIAELLEENLNCYLQYPNSIIIMCFALHGILEKNFASTLSQTLPHHIPNFVGRKSETKELFQSLLNYTASAPRIVSITGAPGFGKSSLAVHIGHKLTDYVKVIYVDLYEVSNKDEMIARILNGAKNSISSKFFNTRDLYSWSESLKQQTLVLFDNCDEKYHTDEDFQRTYISGLIRHSKFKFLKVLTTSRNWVMYTERQHTIVLTELSQLHSYELLNSVVSSLNPTVRTEVAELTGGAPLALKVVGALLNAPALTQQMIVEQLKENLISTLSPEELSVSDRINTSIFLSYKYLESDVQQVGRFLSYFTGSFSRTAGIQVASNGSAKKLHTLVKMSLLEYNHETDRYVYHRLIREFFKGVSNPNESTEFKINYLEYYSTAIEEMIEKGLSKAVSAFYIDKHNYRYYFDLIGSTKFNANRATNIIKRVTDTISSFVKTDANLFQKCGFTSSELYEYVESYLAILKQNNRLLINTYSKDWFVKTYSGLILDLLRVERLLNKDVNVQIKHMEGYRGFFDNYHTYIYTQNYLTFFNTLAMHYEAVGNEKMTKSCYAKILQKENFLGECENECSNFEIAKAFHFKGDCDKSIFYSEKSLNSIIKVNVSTMYFEDSMKVAKKLLELEKIYADCQQCDSDIGIIPMMLVAISIRQVLNVSHPPSLVAHGHIIIDLIAYLEANNWKLLSEQIKSHFKHNVKKYAEDEDIMVKQSVQYFFNHNFEMAILFGKKTLNLGNSCLLEQYDKIKLTNVVVAISLVALEKHQESVTFFEDVANMHSAETIGLNFLSCAHLLRAGSLKICFTQLHTMMWEVILSVHTNFYNFVFPIVPTKNLSQQSSYDDFLFTQLQVKFQANYGLIKASVPSGEKAKKEKLLNSTFNRYFSFSYLLFFMTSVCIYFITFCFSPVLFGYYIYCKVRSIKIMAKLIMRFPSFVLLMPMQILTITTFLGFYAIVIFFAQIDVYKVVVHHFKADSVFLMFIIIPTVIWFILNVMLADPVIIGKDLYFSITFNRFLLHEVIDMSLFVYFLIFFCILEPYMYFVPLLCLCTLLNLCFMYITRKSN